MSLELPLPDSDPFGDGRHYTAEAMQAYAREAQRMALEEAAKMCEQMQRHKTSKVPDGAWMTLGTDQIDGRTFAAAIRKLAEGL